MSYTDLLMEESHLEVGINAVADFGDTGVQSDVVSMKNHQSVRFIVHWGVGATGTQTITVEACDDVVPTNTSAVPFYSRTTVAAAAPGAITARTSSGFTTTAGSNQVIEIEVRADALAASGYGYVRLKLLEVVNSPRSEEHTSELQSL